jgi:hypothetical protein
MSRAQWRALIAAVLLAAFVAVIGIAGRERSTGRRSPGERPVLLLLSSLPIAFPEDFSLDAPASPVWHALDSRYRVVPISVADPAQLGKGRLLLMAQPFAQPAEDLVALDRWVRSGGQLLLLADPMLEWPSGKALGDATRPPTMFADTGLLGHWGLRLDTPDERGPAKRSLGGETIATVSPGSLHGQCAIAADGLVARCRIGKGIATIIADADFLDVQDLPESSANLDALLQELRRLEAR